MIDELRLHVIEPKYRINWKSPRSLLLTSLLNSIIPDYAPIGHFAVEIISSIPNKYGIHHVLTGMEREYKARSQKIMLQKKLGLGVLLYSFEGALQGNESSRQEINNAKKDKRLKTIVIPSTPERTKAMLDFIDKWIECGSYRVYGGGKKVSEGEGAGCADFAMELFKIATNSLPPSEWSVRLNFPQHLIGDGDKKRISFFSLLDRSSWVLAKEKSVPFEIADTNLVTDWLKEKMLADETTCHYKDSQNQIPISFQDTPGFNFFYPTLSSPKEMWDHIKVI